MTLITRFGTVLLLLTTSLPFLAATSLKTGPSSCQKNEFWYNDKGCCLPQGGPPSPPPPPKGSDCPPSGYYWGKDQDCCVPRNQPPSNHPPPQCKSGWDWVPALYKCVPHYNPPAPPQPHPSGRPGNGGYHGKRQLKSRNVKLCPQGLDACPIAGLTAGDYECIDTATELESCGGCASIGEGQDCTIIPGAWNVGCEQGRCAVYTCAAGFRRSHDGKSCIGL